MNRLCNMLIYRIVTFLNNFSTNHSQKRNPQTGVDGFSTFFWLVEDFVENVYRLLSICLYSYSTIQQKNDGVIRIQAAPL